MGKKLIWNPQDSFKPFFNTAKEVLKYRSVFKEGIQYMIPYGGRGSGKTWTFADAIIVEASLRPIRVLVTREMQNSIVESIKQELEDAIKGRELEGFFDIQERVIKGINGSRFIFKGIKANINNLKSISNVDIVLAEESESITQNSWEKLLPSIRPKSGKDPLFIIIFNPGSSLDDTYQRFIINTPPGSVCKLINWRDNEYFPAHLEKQRKHALLTLPKKQYDHIWEGVPLGSEDNVIIDLEWVKSARFASKLDSWVVTGKKVVGYDPSGQGRDYNAVAVFDGNCLIEVDEWLRSSDLREASERAFSYAVKHNSKFFTYDECGGFGDGVDVFVKDAKIAVKNELLKEKKKAQAADFIKMRISGFNAGNQVHNPDSRIKGTKKTNGEMYANLKAQTWAIVAQQLYNTYRYVVLGERDIDMRDMISIDIEDDTTFNKLAKELSTGIWEKSEANSKKKVESKDKMFKRTSQPSPNIADAFVMTRTPKLPSGNIKDLL